MLKESQRFLRFIGEKQCQFQRQVQSMNLLDGVPQRLTGVGFGKPEIGPQMAEVEGAQKFSLGGRRGSGCTDAQSGQNRTRGRNTGRHSLAAMARRSR